MLRYWPWYRSLPHLLEMGAGARGAQVQEAAAGSEEPRLSKGRSRGPHCLASARIEVVRPLACRIDPQDPLGVALLLLHLLLQHLLLLHLLLLHLLLQHLLLQHLLLQHLL